MKYRKTLAAPLALLLFIFSCSGPESNRPDFTAEGPIHLVEYLDAATIEGPEFQNSIPPAFEWQFGGSIADGLDASPTRGWQAGPGVMDLEVRNGGLVGLTTSDWPIIHVERSSGLENRDHVCAIEIRMHVSTGTQLAVSMRSSDKVDVDQIAEEAKKGLGHWLNVPISSDGEVKTYTLRTRFPVLASEIKHVLISPTDAKGATFRIESVRVLSRRGYFVRNSPQVSWQGLGAIFHRTIVAKVPDVIRMTVSLPGRPWLDLALGTIEDNPITFQVSIRPAARSPEEVPLLEFTISTPRRWEPVQIDLSDYAGKEVSISLSLKAKIEGAVGFWGSPVIRNSGALPQTVASDSEDFSKETPQGVILIWIDTLRWDHLNVYGHSKETAPVLSRMAAEGVLFHDCITPANWTLPSTASLLTSQSVTSHGLMDGSPSGYDWLPTATKTMAEVFRDAGYATISFSSVWFIGRYFNMHQGFDESHEFDSLDRTQPNWSKSAREYIDRLDPWLYAHREVPFFVFLHVFDPHAPYESYPPYDTLWVNPSRKAEYESSYEKAKEYIEDPERIGGKILFRRELEVAGIDPDNYISVPKDWYDGSIRGMDAEIGKLLERLEGLGLDEKTLVIVSSDHGEQFFEHGGMGHGYTLYSEETHVPLLFRWPGVIPESIEVIETVRTIDLMPTILDMCRLPLPDAMQGQSLVPMFFARERITHEPAVSEYLLPEHYKERYPEKSGDISSIIFEGWKLIHNSQPRQGQSEFELYDHLKDPLDQHNLSDKFPEIVQRLTGELKTWQVKAEAARLSVSPDLEKNLSSEEIKRLRSLGYIK
jgi:arylsulfatase A-like enzyme